MELFINEKQVGFEELRFGMNFPSIASSLNIKFSTMDSHEYDSIMPFQYESVVIKEGSQLIFTGNIVILKDNVNTKGEMFDAVAASTGSVIQENTPSFEGDAFQFTDFTLKEIAEYLCSPYNITVYYSPVCEQKRLEYSIIEEIEVGRNDSIINTLKKISRHLGLIVRHDERGGILFTYTDVNDKTVANFDDTNANISLSFNGQNVFNTYNLLQEEEIGVFTPSGADTTTVTNYFSQDSNLDIGVKKEKTYKSRLRDGEESEETANREIKAQRSLAYRNIKVVLQVDGHVVPMEDRGWINQSKGVLIAGDVIFVQSDKSRYLKNGYRFIVDSLSITENKSGSSQTITCVPHEAYTNETIKKFWK